MQVYIICVIIQSNQSIKLSMTCKRRFNGRKSINTILFCILEIVIFITSVNSKGVNKCYSPLCKVYFLQITLITVYVPTIWCVTIVSMTMRACRRDLLAIITRYVSIPDTMYICTLFKVSFVGVVMCISVVSIETCARAHEGTMLYTYRFGAYGN